MNDRTDRRFALKVQTVTRGARGEDVGKAQQYLARYGYLQAPYEPGRLDKETSDALGKFQESMGIEASGAIDPNTVSALEQPRCGVPDLPRVERAFSTMPPAFRLRGCDYEADFRTLTYSTWPTYRESAMSPLSTKVSSSAPEASPDAWRDLLSS